MLTINDLQQKIYDVKNELAECYNYNLVRGSPKLIKKYIKKLNKILKKVNKLKGLY